MTLLKCFTDSHIDNIAACLRLQSERMILMGSLRSMEAAVPRYRKLLKDRNRNTEIHLLDISGKSYGDLCAALLQLVRQQDKCVIDLTGGDESLIMAVGAVLGGLEESVRREVEVQTFRMDLGDVVDCVHDNCVLPHKPANLTVEELVALHGGCLYTKDYQPPLDITSRDLDGLWRIVREDPKQWNRAIMQLGEFESRSDSKTHIYLPLYHLQGRLANFPQKETEIRRLLDKLHRQGVLTDRSSRDALEYIYTSKLLQYCTRKAGNVLEVKTLLEGRAAQKRGKPLFQDCRMSVSIDWDGILHDPAQRMPETRNEIDVVLMHGLTPVFISCKNGNIGEEELYKLHTVATRFGGPYARKMLIATDLDRKSTAANRAFMQRAWDMDIYLVTDAAELTHEEWEQTFLRVLQ